MTLTSSGRVAAAVIGSFPQLRGSFQPCLHHDVSDIGTVKLPMLDPATQLRAVYSLALNSVLSCYSQVTDVAG